MNERNADALTEILSDYVMGPGHWQGLDGGHLAEYLATRGVLVPSALEDQQIREVLEVGKVCVQQDDPLFHEDAARDVLERIAKGES